MGRLQKLLVILLGAASAASLYLYLAASMSHGIVSYHAAIYVLIFGWLAIPALAIALNITGSSVLTVTLSSLSSPLIALYFLVAATRLPGAEWMSSDFFTHLAYLYVLAGLIIAMKLPRAIPLLLASCLICFLVGGVAVHSATKWAMEKQIQLTLMEGGCAISGMTEPRRVSTANDVALGWIVGPRSEPLYLVYDQYYLRWSYSRFGPATRGGHPEQFALTDIASTQRYARMDRLSCG